MTTELNVPLLLKTIGFIEHHPEEWRQEFWRTCFAAHAALIDGGEWASATGISMLARDDDPADKLWPRHYLTGDRMTIDVGDRAQHALRLTDDQACRLWSRCNSLDDLRAEVYRIAGDWERLAEVAIAAATNGINDSTILPSAYADPAYDLDTKHRLWSELKDEIAALQAAEDPATVLDCEMTGSDHDGETYLNDLRGLVDDAVHKLIGRTS